MTADKWASEVRLDMAEADYHAHPALSSSGARKLLPPSCPARFRYERDHGQEPRKVFDIGHAAHALVLGAGAPVRCIEALDWRTNAAKQARDEAREQGKTPLLRADYEKVRAMADALGAGLDAFGLRDLFTNGRPEVSAFWTDERHGVERRSRFDWLPNTDGGQLSIVDYKTTASAETGAIQRAIASYGYHQQAAWYIDTARALGIAEDVRLLFVFQEKTAPYLVNVVTLDDLALTVGRSLNDEALQVFAECTATDTWPGYATEIETLPLPLWAVRDELEMSLT